MSKMWLQMLVILQRQAKSINLRTVRKTCNSSQEQTTLTPKWLQGINIKTKDLISEESRLRWNRDITNWTLMT